MGQNPVSTFKGLVDYHVLPNTLTLISLYTRLYLNNYWSKTKSSCYKYTQAYIVSLRNASSHCKHEYFNNFRIGYRKPVFCALFTSGRESSSSRFLLSWNHKGCGRRRTLWFGICRSILRNKENLRDVSLKMIHIVNLAVVSVRARVYLWTKMCALRDKGRIGK